MFLSLSETEAGRYPSGFDVLVNIKIIDYGAVSRLNQLRRAADLILAVEYSRDGALPDASLKCVPHLTNRIFHRTRKVAFLTVLLHICPDLSPTFPERLQIAQVSQRVPRTVKAFLREDRKVFAAKRHEKIARYETSGQKGQRIAAPKMRQDSSGAVSPHFSSRCVTRSFASGYFLPPFHGA